MFAPPAPSYAESEPVPLDGIGCGYVVTAVDPADPSRVVGVVYGDVVVADVRGLGAATPATVTLTCSIQTASYAHSAPDDATATGSGVNGAVVAPVPFSVPKPGPWRAVAVCSRVDVTDADGTRSYWLNSQNGMWYRRDYGTCNGAPQCLAYGRDCVWDVAFAEWVADRTGVTPGLVWDVVDPVVCAVLKAYAPGTYPVEIRSDGDVYVAGELVWDCPPYGLGA